MQSGWAQLAGNGTEDSFGPADQISQIFILLLGEGKYRRHAMVSGEIAEADSEPNDTGQVRSQP